MNKEHPRLNLWEKQPFDSDKTDVSRETSEVYGEYCTMGASLMQRRRVRDGGLRVVNLLRQ